MKNKVISQRNDATSINSKRGMARRAKRNASKVDRQLQKKILQDETNAGTDQDSRGITAQ